MSYAKDRAPIYSKIPMMPKNNDTLDLSNQNQTFAINVLAIILGKFLGWNFYDLGTTPSWIGSYGSGMEFDLNS